MQKTSDHLSITAEACVFLPESQQGLAELCGKQDLGEADSPNGSHNSNSNNREVTVKLALRDTWDMVY